MNPQERIAELERLAAEQQKELAALKAELNKPEVNYDGPKEGYFWHRCHRAVRHTRDYIVDDGIVYSTPEQAQWQGNSERVRRKLQRIAKALNPTGWKVTLANRTNSYEITTLSGVNVGAGIYFASHSLREQAREILGDDIKYLNWYNSPEFKA